MHTSSYPTQARLLERFKLRALPVLSGLLAVEGLLALMRLASIPGDPKNALLLGFSASRLALMAALLGLGLGFAGIAVISWRHSWLATSRGAAAALVLGIVFGAAAWIARVALNSEGEGLATTYERLSPLLMFLSLMGLQAALVLVLVNLHPQPEEKPLFLLSAAIFGFLLLIWGLVVVTGLGLVPDGSPWWGIPGVPLLIYQVLGVCVLGLLALLAGRRFPAFGRFLSGGGLQRSRADWLAALLIWALAVGVWMSFPSSDHSYFSPVVRPPNYEIYPLSDAGFYEFAAQSIVIGEGFLHGQVLTRPLFILALAGLNAVVGPSYDRLVLAQTLVLALFPVVLYFLARRLQSRAAGMVIALLAVVREVNSIQSTPLVTVSNSKLLLSDFPTALALSALALLALAWLQEPRKNPLHPLWVGGGLGLLMLVRSQAVVMAPFLLLLALPVYWPKRARWLGACALFALGLVLAVAPWLARNYSLTGKIMFDQPMQTASLASRFSRDFSTPARLPQEDESTYAARLMGSIRAFSLANPGYVAGFAAAHFANNEIQTALVLPVKTGWNNFSDTLFVRTPFWQEWNGRLGWGEALLLSLNLALIAIGLAVTWQRWRWAGLLPLVINLSYSLSNAVARNSGWRYMLPADWVGYFYFAIGLVQVFSWLLNLSGRLVTRNDAPATPSVKHKITAATAAGTAATILLLGALLPFFDVVIPERYPEQSKEQVLAELMAQPSLQKSGIDAKTLREYAARDDIFVVKGRILYPRFYPKGVGEPTEEWPVYLPRDYPRLAFLVINQRKWNVNFRASKSPEYFPNAADIILVGCTSTGGIDPAVMTVMGKKNVTYLRPDTAQTICPLAGGGK